MPGKCPKCGRIIREPATPAEAPAEQVSSCPIDDDYSCNAYRHLNRDPFWPTFAHPRYISCKQLYRK